MKLIVWIHTQYTQKWEFDYKPIWYLLEEYFKNSYITIKFSIDWWAKARKYEKGVFEKYSEIFIIPKNPSIIRYVMEILYMFFYLIFAKIKYKKISYLWIDPLSAFSGAILRKIWIIDRFILITPDFTEKRFDNKILNSAYFFCDKICTKFSDYNYCSSTETIKRKEQIYRGLEKKLKHIPGYPPESIVKKIEVKRKKTNSIVFVGWIYGQINFEKIFDELYILSQEYEGLEFSIVGDGSHLKQCQDYVYAKKYDFVKILWYCEYEDALKIISESEVGIALYNGDLFFDKYRDSCKVRDYLAFWTIPVMTDVVPSTAGDIKKFNAWVVISVDEISDLANILKNVLGKKEGFFYGIEKLNQHHKDKYLELIKDLKC